MLVRELYLRALDKLNKIITNNEQDVPEYIFVYNWNEAQNHYVANNYKVDEFNRPIASNLQDILVNFTEQPILANNNLYTTFKYPDNYLYYNNSYTIIEGCPNVIENKLKRVQDAINLIKNPAWAPSKDFEQTIITLTKEGIIVYHDNVFTPKHLVLSYYEKPRKIDIADGHFHLDGTETKDIDPIWSNPVILEEILDITVKLITENYSDSARYTTMMTHIKETQTQVIK